MFFYNKICYGKGSKANYNLVWGLVSVLLCAKNWVMLGVDWLFGVSVMNCSQMEEFGQERGYTGQNERKLG